jgi:hypothetical protein
LQPIPLASQLQENDKCHQNLRQFDHQAKHQPRHQSRVKSDTRNNLAGDRIYLGSLAGSFARFNSDLLSGVHGNGKLPAVADSASNRLA